MRYRLKTLLAIAVIIGIVALAWVYRPNSAWIDGDKLVIAIGPHDEYPSLIVLAAQPSNLSYHFIPLWLVGLVASACIAALLFLRAALIRRPKVK